jgi:Uma2 family endonuclease
MADTATPQTVLEQAYKIELNAWGKTEIAPASNRHCRLQALLAVALGRQLQGMVLVGCSVLTKSGILVPDVAWASPSFMQSFGEITPYMQAPEICVEILSAADVEAETSEKTAAYLAAGADEVWLVSEDGSVRYLSSSGPLAKSRFPITLSLPAPLPSPTER